MIAELKITFPNREDNLLSIIKTSYQNNNLTLATIINNTIYKNRVTYHNCFDHGFQATDATLLFQIIGSELLVHIEIPTTNNLFVSLCTKVNTYFKNIISTLKNYGISIDKIDQEVLISSEDSYIFIGKIPNRNKEFLKRLENDKLRIIIIPSVLLILNLSAKYIKLIDNIQSTIISFFSAIVGLVFWYVLDYMMLTNDKNFKYEPINE